MIFGLLALVASPGPAIADSRTPDVPGGLSASVVSGPAIRVSWERPYDDVGVQGYNVYRDGSYRATVFDTSYTDYGAADGARHAYRVTAFDAVRNYTTLSAEVAASAGGASANGSGGGPGGMPAAPGGLRLESRDGPAVRIAWSNADGAEGYNVYRDGGYRATVRSTAYTDERTDAGREHRYRVVTFSADRRFSTKSGELVVRPDGQSPSAGVRSARADQGGGGGGSDGASGVPGGYRLVFSDEFRGGGVDGSKWNTRYRWGPDWIVNDERQYYIDVQGRDIGRSPFEHDGERLTIKAERTPDSLRGPANGQPWLSGAMTTYGKFSMRYGYVEMRAKFPAGQGLWPAFWLLHEGENGSRPEIDVVEFVGKRRDKVYQTYHYYENYVLRSTPSFEVGGADYSSEFRNYGMKWEPGKITWYVDGRETNRYQSGNVSSENMYLLVNLAVGGVWNGDPDGSTPSPARYTIDWIRAYAAP